MQGKRKPGRPKGSKTTGEVVGKKRARKYFDLRFDMGIPPSEAAKAAAQEFGVEQADIFAAATRHMDSVAGRHAPALAAEFGRKADEIERKNQEMRAVIEMGPHRLKGYEGCLHIFLEALKGNTK